MAQDENYKVIVEKVIPRGPHGPYAIASCDGIGSITFSLEKPTWQESDWPEPGTYVILSAVRKKRAGWRANSGRYLKPSDEQQKKQARSKENG